MQSNMQFTAHTHRPTQTHDDRCSCLPVHPFPGSISGEDKQCVSTVRTPSQFVSSSDSRTLSGAHKTSVETGRREDGDDDEEEEEADVDGDRNKYLHASANIQTVRQQTILRTSKALHKQQPSLFKPLTSALSPRSLLFCPVLTVSFCRGPSAYCYEARRRLR